MSKIMKNIHPRHSIKKVDKKTTICPFGLPDIFIIELINVNILQATKTMPTHIYIINFLPFPKIFLYLIFIFYRVPVSILFCKKININAYIG